MLREPQKRLEERIADVQAQNSKLKELVNRSNVNAVEAAIKERNEALNREAKEKQKADMAKKNAKAEIAKAKRQAKVKMQEMKNKIRFWQLTAAGMFVAGIVVGWML